MGLPAIKHLDPVVGVDVHSVLVAPSPTPVFLPHPHVGFMLDLREYVNAALGVIGSIAFTIVEDMAVDYLEDHPDVAQSIDHAASKAAGALQDVANNPLVAQGMKAESMAGDIANAAGAGVGMGSTAGRPIFVNGMLRATAGTHAFHVPALHFPLGESFAPPDPKPSNDSEAYMGSKTVLANNDPMSFMALPAMSCWALGLEPPTHNGAHTAREHLSLPTSVMLPIPAGRPVLVGGPPIVNMAALAKGLFKAFRGSKFAKALADKLHLKPGFLKCKVLDAEPVDSITGEVIVQQRDFTVEGRLPLAWNRHYASHDMRRGETGVGWQTPADIRLELMRHEGAIGVAVHFPDHATAFDALPETAGWPARIHDWQHGHALYRREDRLVIRTRAAIEYEFALPAHWPRAVDTLAEGDALTMPVLRMAHLNGNGWVFERGADGALERIVEWKGQEPAGRVIVCERNPAGSATRLLTALTLTTADGRAHPLVSYDHDQQGNLIAALDAMGLPRRFAYEADHRMVHHTSARGVSFYYSHQHHDDGRWRVDHAWGDDGLFDYRFVYDVEHRETRITDSLGHVTILQTNERGLPVARIDPLGGVTRYQYDERGRTRSQIDPAGRVTLWEHDARGNLLAHTLADGSVMRAEYDADHRLVCASAPGGRRWRYRWDERGNLLERIMPDEASYRYEYDRDGQLILHTGPRGTNTRFVYDDEGNLADIIDALGTHTRFRHDARGNLIEMLDGLGQSSRYEYDRNGNLTRAIEPGEREFHCSYDADGNLIRYRDPRGHVTQLEYSALGQMRRRLAPDGGVLEYRYDTEERLTGVVNERGEVHELRRDALGRIVEEIDYWGQSRRYEFGAANELLRSIDPLGRAIDYGTDLLGRIVQKRLPDSNQSGAIRTETFSYDQAGNLVAAENPDSRVELSYDVAGRLVEEKQGDDFVIAYGYDAAGNRIERRTRLIADDQVVTHTVRYEYDALDAVSAIRIDDAAPITFERDELGQIRVERIGEVLQREFSYTSEGHVAKQALLSGAGPLFESEYAYDADGGMTHRQDSRFGSEHYDYDPVGRLTAHLDPTGRLHRFLYDQAGDLLKTKSYRHDSYGASRQGPHNGSVFREEHIDGCHYCFDKAGNLIRKQSAACDVSLSWDADGRLIETQTRHHAGDELLLRARYVYDAFHRRIRKVVHAQADRAASKECVSRFFWDCDALVSELASGKQSPERLRDEQSELREWIYYPETHWPLASAHRSVGAPKAYVPIRDSTQYLFYCCEPNGAPVRVVDALGEVKWEARYTSRGGAIVGALPSVDQPLRLQGQYHDAESGLAYNRYRYYDPATGSFISQDPIGLLGGTNPYQFAPNIFGWADPLGLDTQPSLPDRIIASEGNTSIVHYYSSPKEHADPIHFHIEQGGRSIGSIKADGTIIRGRSNRTADQMLSERSTISKMRKAEGKIANYIRKVLNSEVGGRPFRPGNRGASRGGCGDG